MRFLGIQFQIHFNAVKSKVNIENTVSCLIDMCIQVLLFWNRYLRRCLYPYLNALLASLMSSSIQTVHITCIEWTALCGLRLCLGIFKEYVPHPVSFCYVVCIEIWKVTNVHWQRSFVDEWRRCMTEYKFPLQCTSI